jgi:hypothetical protein
MSLRVGAESAREAFMQHFEDPLTLDIMKKPVMDECGCIFDEASIQSYYNRYHKIGEEGEYAICPMTGQHIHMNQLRPARLVKAVIEDAQTFVDGTRYLKLQQENEKLRHRVMQLTNASDQYKRELRLALANMKRSIWNQNLLTDQARIKEKQIENLNNMGLVTSVLGVFIPKIRFNAKNQGLTERDYTTLATRPKLSIISESDLENEEAGELQFLGHSAPGADLAVCDDQKEGVGE